MAAYKLTYFNARGGAEVVRFIFVQAGVAYEDRRVEGEEWAKLKPTTPTGQLPMLEVEGKILTGSRTIARFVGERLGLAGANDLENAQLDAMIDYLFDFLQKMYPWFYEKDEAKKATLWSTIRDEHIPKYWQIINKWIEDNQADGSWIFGNRPTYVDFSIYLAVDVVKSIDSEVLSQFPAVLRNYAAVESLPNIAKWIKERPVTQH